MNTFGYHIAEFRRGNHFDVSSIAENEAFEFVVYHHFERQLYTAVAETLLYLLRIMKGLRLDIG